MVEVDEAILDKLSDAVYLLLQVRRFFLWDLRREFVRLEGFNGIKLVPFAVPISSRDAMVAF